MLRKTRTERTNPKTDMAALEAWCLRVEKITIKKIRIPRQFSQYQDVVSNLPR